MELVGLKLQIYTSRYVIGGAGADNTSVLIYGGFTPPVTAVSEEWAGAGAALGAWSTATAMNTARNGLGGAGTYTAALGFGGSPGYQTK